MCLFVPFAWKDLGGTLEGQFDPILTTLDPFEGPGGRLRLGHVRAASGLEDLFGPRKPCPKPQILAILTTFPNEKVNICHFAYQGSVKMPF